MRREEKNQKVNEKKGEEHNEEEAHKKKGRKEKVAPRGSPLGGRAVFRRRKFFNLRVSAADF
jgi:hypothetical protein